MTKPLRERIAAGHPWVYDRALERPGGVAAGDLVTLVDDRGPLATALADPGSPIRARVLDRRSRRGVRRRVGARARGGGGTAPGARSAARRLHRAAARPRRGRRLRRARGRRICRHGRRGLRRTRPRRGSGARACPTCSTGSTPAPRSPHAWVRGDRKDRELGRRSGVAARGNPPAEIVIAEDDARFAVDVRAGQKTGFFLDQRENRRVDPPARSRRERAQRVLLHGRVLAACRARRRDPRDVDRHRRAGDRRDRAQPRAVEAAGRPPRAVAIDAFDFFDRAAARGDRWDLVIVDPPSFAPSEKARAGRAEVVCAAGRRGARDDEHRRPVRARVVLEPRHRGRSARAVRAARSPAALDRGRGKRSPGAAGISRGPISQVPAVRSVSAQFASTTTPSGGGIARTTTIA